MTVTCQVTVTGMYISRRIMAAYFILEEAA
jgi:hypothetical protein